MEYAAGVEGSRIALIDRQKSYQISVNERVIEGEGCLLTKTSDPIHIRCRKGFSGGRGELVIFTTPIYDGEYNEWEAVESIEVQSC